MMGLNFEGLDKKSGPGPMFLWMFKVIEDGS